MNTDFKTDTGGLVIAMRRWAKVALANGGIAGDIISLGADRLSELQARAEKAEAELADIRSLLIYADQILDDIDTCSDAHKPMYSTYSQNVMKLCIKGKDARRAAIDAAMKEASK